MSLKMLPRRLPSSNHESEELEFSVRVWKGKYSLQDHDSEEDGGESGSFSGAIHPPEPVDRDSMKKPNPNCLVKSLSVKGPFLDDLSIKELIKNPKNPDDISIKELVKNPRNPDEGFSMKKPNPNCLVKSLSVKGPFLDDLSIKELLKNPKNPDDISIKELVKNPRNPHEGFLEEASEETDECVWDASLPPSANASPHSSLDRNCESAKTSVSRASDSSGLSDDSNWTNLTSGGANKPHQGNDPIWKAIMAVRGRDGNLGMGHFRLLRRLGCGDIGSVYLSELSGTRCYFAMKVMDKESLLARKKLNRTQTEREILQLLDHPFLPTLYTHFETDRFSCLVMEFCPGGDLHTLRQRQPGKRFPEYAARFYAAEVLLALEYLHMLGVIYRDLKPENVLVREDGHIMLSDFDLSLQCTVSPTLIKGSSNSIPSSTFCAQPSCVSPSSVCIQPSCFFLGRNKNKTRKPKSEPRSQPGPLPELVAEPTQARSMSFVGTHEYLAPEIIKGEGHGSAVDWWTFGIFLHELLFGKTPFKGSGNRATLFNVVGQQLKIPDSPPTSFASRDLIRGLLVKEPQNRLGVKRGATEIKQHPFFEGVNWALIRSSTPPLIPRPVEIEAPVKAAAPVVVDQVGVGGGESKQQMVDTDMKAGGGKFLDFEFF